MGRAIDPKKLSLIAALQHLVAESGIDLAPRKPEPRQGGGAQ